MIVVDALTHRGYPGCSPDKAHHQNLPLSLTQGLRDAPINLLRSGGESQFARHPALFAENGLMQRALRAFPPGFPC
ncbi:hypothetical protein, partial [Pseudomonas tremae]|uniref:hypothetical protein n=1 Tax=Pseudomonas tremae TaxID=200454 RepID=UPI001F222248